MKKKLIVILLFVAVYGNSQEHKLSTASEFINRSSYVQINMDENEKAIFKSGFGETVSFYPSEITNLKMNNSMFGLQIESVYIIGQQAMSNITTKEVAWGWYGRNRRFSNLV